MFKRGGGILSKWELHTFQLRQFNDRYHLIYSDDVSQHGKLPVIVSPQVTEPLCNLKASQIL